MKKKLRKIIEFCLWVLFGILLITVIGSAMDANRIDKYVYADTAGESQVIVAFDDNTQC